MKFFMTTWERYFLRETLKIFFLFLFVFYFLYVLIDYSNHSRSFQHHHFTFFDIATFYGYEFIKRMDVLIPFALLTACIKTLCSLNVNNELVALMMGGIRLKRLLLPFILIGLFFTGLIYFNTEVLQPKALKYHHKIQQLHTLKKQKKYTFNPVKQLNLEDGSSLIFQHYDEASTQFFDVYWLRSADDIYRIRDLQPNTLLTSPPVGKFVEHLVRTKEGTLILQESVEEMEFPKMHFNKKTLLETVTLPIGQSISSLKNKLPKSTADLSEKEAHIVTTYYYKLALPWLCLLAVIAPAPFCLRFTRNLPVFFIYAIGLFGIVAFYILMDAAVILGNRQIVSPAIAIWLPFTLIFSFFSYRFFRL